MAAPRSVHACAASVLTAVLICTATGPAPAALAPSLRRLNVLLIAVDGLDARLSTPHAAALGARGRRFARAYAPHPLAGPTRLALFTGQRPARLGIWTEATERPDAVLLPEQFQRAGYFTARVGRALGGKAESQVKWDVAESPADTAARLVALLTQPRPQPFFIAAGFDELRPAVGAPATAKGVPSGPERPAIAFDDLPASSRPGPRKRAAAAGEAERQQARRAHEERTRRFDTQLGRVLSALEEAKLWASTVVALVGTEAPALGDHGVLPRPDVLFEERLRAPLVLAGPQVAQPGRSASALVDLTDLFPTLAELAGLPAVDGLDGRSLVPLLSDPDAKGRKAATSVTRRRPGNLGRSVRTARWRYTEWPDGSAELYDHDRDPHEHTNLAQQAAHAAVVGEMKGLLSGNEQRAATATSGAAPTAGGRRPNVLLVVLDDANVHLGSYGYPVQTPHIDRLVRLGRRFDHAYAQVAMCSPSRASLLSGWRPERTGVWDNNEPPRRPGMVPLQEHFQAHGYFTAHVGKVWETRFASDFKWDVSEHVPGVDSDTDRRGRRGPGRGHADVSAYWTKTDNRDEDEPDGRRARRAAELLEQHRDRPFFLAVGFAKPHLRWVVPRRYFDLYDPARIPLVPEPGDDADDIPELAIEHEAARPGLFLGGREPPTDDALRQKAIAAYYAAVTFVDAQVGVLLDALDRLKLWDDTIVVLLGDHGFHLGEHRGLWRKDTLFEEAVRAPLVIAAPGLGQPGVATASLAELVDLYPTLTELAGLPAPPGLDGRSLVPVLRDPQAQVRQAAFSFRQVNPPAYGFSLRTHRFRYTQWPDGSEELFDLEPDPGQRADLAGSPAHAATLSEMRALRTEAEK